MGVEALENELRVVLLLLVVWVSELLCKRLNGSPIIGQIAAGLIVGPALLDLVPHVDAFRLLGKLGVLLLVIESGLAVDWRDVRRCGPRASLAAATGVLIPTLLSFALYTGALGAGWKTALAVGAALSPTSLGFSAQMLGEVGQMTTPIGQLICTAAVIDDVLSLLLLAEVQALGDSNPEWYAYAVPVFASLGSVLLGCLATVFITSKTEPLDAWLSSLDRVNTRGDSHNSGIDHSVESTAIPPPSSGVRLRKQQQLTPSSSASRTTATGTTCSGRDHLDRHADQKVDPALDLVTSKPLGNGVEHEAHEGGHLIAPQIPGGGGGGEDIGPSVVKKGERVLVAMVLALSLLFAYLSALVGSSDLLGCFLGGLAFSAVPGVQSIWGRQMKRYSRWGARLFFSATVAFSVPSVYEDGGLLRPKPLWKGLILTAAAVIGKLFVGLFAGPPLTLSGFSQLGWAMNGRGEFSFFIAQEASEEGILTAEDFSAVVWALLLSSIAAPIAFRRALASSTSTGDERSKSAIDDGRGGDPALSASGMNSGDGAVVGPKADSDNGVSMSRVDDRDTIGTGIA